MCSNNEVQISELKNGKFPEDSITYKDDTFEVYTQGYFLNLDDLKSNNSFDKVETIARFIIRNYLEGKCLSQILKGNYVIIVFDKNKGEICVYNDLLSKHALFYTVYDSIVYLSDNYYRLVSFLQEKNVPLTIDFLAVKIFSVFSVFYDDLTYANEIKYLKPFDYLSFGNRGLELLHVNKPQLLQITEDEVIERMERLFKAAINNQYSKNSHAGYKTCSTLSGGMDSRTTFLYGQAIGYKNHICYCYAESGSVDQSIASKIAKDYGCSFFFHQIDNGDFIFNRDALCDAIGGQTWYPGTTGTFSSLSMYDTKDWGIVNVGLGGGEILGDDCVADSSQDEAFSKFESKLGLDKFECERFHAIKNGYQSYNDFTMVNDLRRCVAGLNMARHFDCEYCSPFLDEDFFQLLMTVPFDIKHTRKLYVDWQKKHNPAQFDYPTTFWRGASTRNIISYQARRVYQYCVRTFLKRKTKYDMNPFDYWERTNDRIGFFMNDTFRKDINVLSNIIPSNISIYLNTKWETAGIVSKLTLLTVTYSLLKMYNHNS